MTSHTDEELVQAIGRGDAKALDALFRRHHARVHQLCCGLVADASAADDLVQETFLKLWRSAAKFERRSTFTTWLYRIVRNACFDHMQSERRRVELHASMPDADHVTDDVRTEVIQRAMRELDPDMREVLVLSRFRDLPRNEVAAILGVSEGAARVRIHRALHRLKEIVQQMEATYDAM